jgi:hypothetical protein
MRRSLVAFSILLAMGSVAAADVSVGIGISVPGLSIGINVPSYPQLTRVPGYPVYYAPSVQANFFFYDGMYWVYQEDNWYASSWYNGPWAQVAPAVVPLYVLRVPVRYYRSPPPYFRGWRPDAPPRWDQHWGSSWQEQRLGWDRWDRRAVPAPAPLPRYQQQYRGDRYPPPERQPELRTQNYRYQPREDAVREHYRQTAPGRPQPAAQAPQRSPGKDGRDVKDDKRRDGDDPRGRENRGQDKKP